MVKKLLLRGWKIRKQNSVCSQSSKAFNHVIITPFPNPPINFVQKYSVKVSLGKENNVIKIAVTVFSVSPNEPKTYASTLVKSGGGLTNFNTSPNAPSRSPPSPVSK